MEYLSPTAMAASVFSLPPIPKPLRSSSTPIKPSSAPTRTPQCLPPKTPQAPSKPCLDQISSLCKQGLLGEAFALLTQMESHGSLPFVGPEIYGELLQACLYDRALPQGRQIHARILKSGLLLHGNEYVETKLLIFYAKCGCLAIAEELFRRQCPRNVFSWAAMIGLRCRLGLDEEALMGFVGMLEAACFPDNFVIPNALKACSALQSIGFGRGIHGYALKMGYASCIYVVSSLVDFYGKCGILQDARKIFEEIPERNVITWNAMLVGIVHEGLNQEVLELFYHMRAEGVQPTRVSISCFLSASANLEALDEGRQGHAVAVLTGLELDNILGSSLINFYCKVGLVEDAEFIFSRVVDKDAVTWNLLISGYVQDGQIDNALTTCYQMIEANFTFDSVTLTSIISASATTCNLQLGKVGHGYCIRNNLESDLAVASSIIDSYASCGRVDYARQVFDLTGPRDLVVWNTMISAYAQNGMSGEALKLFYQMQLESMPANVVSWNSVIMGLLRNGQVHEAKSMLSEMQKNGIHPNLITWTSLIHGLAQNGYGHEAIKLFSQMQSAGIEPNPTSIIALLLACTNVVSLYYGRVIHGYIMRRGLLSSLYVATSLVDMYAKCGSINLAKDLFKMVPDRKLPVYNALISGYALHGQAKEALALYNDMCQTGIEPDEITFTGLLSACTHAGLTDEGQKLLTEMISVYHITPQKEHSGCLATLLARHGRIKEVLSVLYAMPVALDAHALGSLLALCKQNPDMELAEYISECLFNLEPGNIANYVTLANMYAASGRWQEASQVRMLVKQSGLKRTPGCSWIQIGGERHVFVAGDQAHPQTDNIVRTLLCLDREMKNDGCASSVVNFGQIDDKQGNLCY